MFRKSILAVFVVAFATSLPASAQQYVGQTNMLWSADGDRCVPDVVGRFNAMRVRGDDLAFHLGVMVRGAHWQGIQRLKSGNGQYIVVSQSYDQSGLGGFGIVKMESRNAVHARYRSNRLSYSPIQNTAPPSTDRGVSYFQTVSSVTGNVYAHGGAMQVYGNYLTIAAEDRIQGSNFAVDSEVLFYDVSNPEAPVQLPYSIRRSGAKAGTSALTRIADGRYLAMVETAQKLSFYVSSSTSLASPSTQFAPIATWEKTYPGLAPGSIDSNFGNYQAYTFINQCDGKLFLTASNNSLFSAGVVSGEDWLDLYEITLTTGNPHAVVRKAAKKHLYCADAAARTCNLQAGGGAYVTLDGDLMFYSTEHYNDGPLGSVSFSEFNAEPSTCPTIADAWIEIFDDHGFSDRTVFVDYVDRNLRRYDNYNYLEGFNDKASSVRYCLPPGYSYRLYANNTYGGSVLNLSGTGYVGSIYNLGTIGFGDKLSSSRFIP